MNTQTKIAALMTATLMAVAAPAMADDDDHHYRQNSSQYITHEQASKAAVSAVGSGYAKEVDFEYKPHRGSAYFDVEVQTNTGPEYKVIVDAKTGKVLSKHIDY